MNFWKRITIVILILTLFLNVSLFYSFSGFAQEQDINSTINYNLLSSEKIDASDFINSIEMSLIKQEPVMKTIIENKSFLSEFENIIDFTINNVSTSTDLIEYETNLFENMNQNGTGNIIISRDNFNEIHLSKINTTSTSFYQLPLDINITGNEILSIELELDRFMADFSDYAVNKIEFEFDSFILTLILDFSPIYFSSIYNTSNYIYLSAIQDFTKISLIELIDYHNLTIPISLNLITWFAFANQEYTYNTKLTKFSVYKKIENSSLIVNERSIEDFPVTISNINYLNLTSNQNLHNEISYTIEHISLKTIQVSSKFYSSNLHINFTYREEFNTNFSKIILQIPSTLENLTIYMESIGQLFDQNHKIALINNQTYAISGIIFSNIYEYEQIQELYQNNNFSINFTGKSIKNSLLSNYNSSTVGIIMGSIITFMIPWNWPKGQINVHLLSYDLELSHIVFQLLDSPIKLISPKLIEINPFVKEIYTLEIVNASSNKPITPFLAQTNYEDGTFRSSVVDSKLTFWPQEFKVGLNSITIEVQSEGFNKFTYSLMIDVKDPNYDIEINSNRDSLTNVSLFLNFNNFYYSNLLQTLDVDYLNENYFSGNVDQQKMVINISNEKWENQTLDIQLRFSIGNLKDYIIKIIKIDYFHPPHDNIETENSFLIMFSSLMAFGMFGYAIKKVIQNKKNKYFSF